MCTTLLGGIGGHRGIMCTTLLGGHRGIMCTTLLGGIGVLCA